jgi:hypothetical protein
MIRQTLILAAAILVATAAHAQVDVAAVKEFVSTIESGAYSSYDGGVVVSNYAPLNLAESLYLADPTIPAAGGPYSGGNFILLEDSLIGDLQDFDYYWVSNGSYASLFDPSPLGKYGPYDTPIISASYIINSTSNAETLWALKAPEIDPASVASGFTLLLGSLLVLRGRRRTELQSPAA